MKYPKTLHLKGSKGIIEEDQIDLNDLTFDRLIIEEKLDGAEVSIGFDEEGIDQIKNRNNDLFGAQFDLFYPWYYERRENLYEVLGKRYVLWGEWLRAKHTVFYDALPSYFMSYDLFDKEEKLWLTTEARVTMLEGVDISHVPLLYQGPPEKAESFDPILIRPSSFKTGNWIESMREECEKVNYSWDRAWSETEPSMLPEGLYIKTEKEGKVTGFYKYIRESFLRNILESGSHWKDRTMIPNLVKSK